MMERIIKYNDREAKYRFAMVINIGFWIRQFLTGVSTALFAALLLTTATIQAATVTSTLYNSESDKLLNEVCPQPWVGLSTEVKHTEIPALVQFSISI